MWRLSEGRGIHHLVHVGIDRMDHIEHIHSGKSDLRSISVHTLEPRSVNAGGHTGAGDHDVPEPPFGKRPH